MDEAMKKEFAKQGEIMAKTAVECTFTLIEKYIDITETKVDDAVLPFLEMAKKYVLDQCDKIDGE